MMTLAVKHRSEARGRDAACECGHSRGPSLSLHPLSPPLPQRAVSSSRADKRRADIMWLSMLLSNSDDADRS